MSAQCRTQLWAHNATHNCERTMPHTIVSAECCTQLWAQNAAHYCEGRMPRTMPLNFLSCRAGNGIILTLLQTLHNFSLSSVTPRAVNIYLQHVECVFEFKWLCFTVTNSISHDPSSIGYTTQRLVLQQHQLWVLPHHTGALCIRQVLVVPIFLHLPELCIMGSFLFAHVSPA